MAPLRIDLAIIVTNLIDLRKAIGRYSGFCFTTLKH